jgi:hypothetical protein
MRQIPHGQHKTLIGIIREHVIAWRTDLRLSREKIVAYIVEKHEEIGNLSGIVFDPVTRDEDERRKVNAERVFRWLDDQSKENNLLPANFIPSVLAAMPIERRMACASEILVSVGLGVRLLDDSDEGDPDINDVIQNQLAHGAALHAATVAIHNPTPENLEAAELHFITEEKVRAKLRKKLTAARIRVVGKAKDLIHRAFHRKEQS